MKCQICNKPIGIVYSRQIYVEQRPTDDFCKECFKDLVPLYDQLIQNMRNKRCITSEQTNRDSQYKEKNNESGLIKQIDTLKMIQKMTSE